jgi:hypothetical protein
MMWFGTRVTKLCREGISSGVGLHMQSEYSTLPYDTACDVEVAVALA